MIETWILVLLPLCNVCTPLTFEFRNEAECVAAAGKVKGGYWTTPFCIGPTKGRGQ